MIQGRHTPLDYFFFLRPVLLPPVWTIALLGTIPLHESRLLSASAWSIFFLHLTALFGGVYTLNQIYDIESDRLNRKLYFLPEGIISLRSAWIFTIVLDIAALGLSLVFGWVHLALTLVIVLLGIVYSVGSSPWKNHPWLGLISNAIGHGLVVFLFGAVISGRPLSENWIGGLAYTLAVGAVYLATTVPDVEGDGRTGKRTLAVAWGARATMIVSGALVSIAIVLAAWSNDRYLAFAGIAAWPFFLRAVLRPSSATIAAKAAVGALSVAAAVAYPLYVILLLSGFVATRLFSRWRFGVTYPTFV